MAETPSTSAAGWEVCRETKYPHTCDLAGGHAGWHHCPTCPHDPPASAALTALDDLAARLRRRHRDLLDEASGTIGDLAMRRLVHQAQGVDLALRDLMEVARGIK